MILETCLRVKVGVCVLGILSTDLEADGRYSYDIPEDGWVVVMMVGFLCFLDHLIRWVS